MNSLQALLRAFDFSPGRLELLPMMLKTLWVVCICNFSATEILGLSIYVVCAPLTLTWVLFKPQIHAQFLANKEKENSKPGAVKTGFRLQAFLIASLIIWFSLYGSSTSKGPLLAALFLTGVLFIVRLSRVTPYTTMSRIGESGPSSKLVRFASGYTLNVVRQFVEKPPNEAGLAASFKTQRWILRKVRYFSIFFRGSIGERRAALALLFRYIYDLSLLACLLILFWAIYFKFYNSPHLHLTKDALIASASHIIPGVPEPSGIAMNKTMEIIIPFSGWVMFVLFIGPVASMFPAYQDRYLKQIKNDYDQLRIWRGALYRITEALDVALKAHAANVKVPPVPTLPAASEARLPPSQ